MKVGLKMVLVVIKNELILLFRLLILLILLGNKKFFVGFFVVVWMVRLINLIVNDFCFLIVKDKWVEREEWKKLSLVKNDVGKKFGKEEEFEFIVSFSVQWCLLFRVFLEEFFYFIKEIIKIVQCKLIGKLRFWLGKVRKEIEEEKEEKIGKDLVDMGFVVFDLYDGISMFEKGMW